MTAPTTPTAVNTTRSSSFFGCDTLARVKASTQRCNRFCSSLNCPPVLIIKVVEGDDLFKTALGSFWGANEDARLHVSHCVELMEALLHASGSTDSVRASALAHGCRALELDRSDGGGGASAGGAGSSYGVSSSTAPTAEPDSKKNSSDSGFGDDYRAPCHSVALLGILLGLPEALGLGSNGVERSPAKKAKLGGSLAKGESSKALSAAAAGGSKASSNSHGGALAALEAIPRSLQRRCLKVRLPSYCP